MLRGPMDVRCGRLAPGGAPRRCGSYAQTLRRDTSGTQTHTDQPHPPLSCLHGARLLPEVRALGDFLPHRAAGGVLLCWGLGGAPQDSGQGCHRCLPARAKASIPALLLLLLQRWPAGTRTAAPSTLPPGTTSSTGSRSYSAASLGLEAVVYCVGTMQQ